MDQSGDFRLKLDEIHLQINETLKTYRKLLQMFNHLKFRIKHQILIRNNKSDDSSTEYSSDTELSSEISLTF